MKTKLLYIPILAIFIAVSFYAGWYAHQPPPISQPDQYYSDQDSIRPPAIDALYKKYGCDNVENDGAFNECVAKVYKILSAQQASMYKKFLYKLNNWPDNLCPAYSPDLMKEALIPWYQQDDSYISARCSVEAEITGSASTDVVTVCKLEHVVSNVEFLQRLIDESHGYAPLANGSCG